MNFDIDRTPSTASVQCRLTGKTMIARAFRAIACTVALLGAAPTPTIACGDIPALGAAIDRLMATGDARKTYPDIDAERARIAHLARSGEEARARQLEEDAMRLLGFEKRWLRCGEGTFMWVRMHPSS